MLRRTVAMATATVAVTAALLGVAPAATAAPVGDPWGPAQVLYKGPSSERVAQATTSDGTTVAVIQTNGRFGSRPTLVAIRPAGGTWGTPVRLSDRRAIHPTVLAWGDGQLSVIWTSTAGRDTYRFHVRSLTDDGTLSPREGLVKATYAYPVFQAAINSRGQVALAWSNGDLYDRVVVRQLDGTWKRYPKVPVLHPTDGGLQYISNPRALFLDDAGRVSNITWGTVDGSDRAIWLTRPDGHDDWTTQQIGPVEGGTTEYGYVDAAAYASNARGDLVVTWEQKDASGAWSSRLRFAAAGHGLGAPTTLSDYWCFIDDPSPCAGVTIAKDGTATVAYAREAGGDNIIIEAVRRDPSGTFTPAQDISGKIWRNVYNGVQVAGNARGDAVVSFSGGDHSTTQAAFARCQAAKPCTKTLWLNKDPSWLDTWTTSMSADAETTVTWSQYYHSGVATRQLAPLG